jgi:hypothetical protein
LIILLPIGLDCFQVNGKRKLEGEINDDDRGIETLKKRKIEAIPIEKNSMIKNKDEGIIEESKYWEFKSLEDCFTLDQVREMRLR